MAASSIVMGSDFGKKLTSILDKAEIKTYLRSAYVDDIRLIIKLFRNLKWNDDTKSFDILETDVQNDLEKLTVYCAEELRKAMESINPDLRFTIELEADFHDKKLPTLDTNIWFSRPESGAPIVQYEFFEKSMNSKFCILEKSAMAYESKLSILSNEVVRRLLNTSKKIPQDKKDSIMNGFVHKMLLSGYSVGQCRDILISGIRFFNAQVSRAKQSGSKLHRSAQSSLVSRLKKKITAKTSWYKPRPNKDNCQAQTPGPENKNKKSPKKI